MLANENQQLTSNSELILNDSPSDKDTDESDTTLSSKVSTIGDLNDNVVDEKSEIVIASGIDDSIISVEQQTFQSKNSTINIDRVVNDVNDSLTPTVNTNKDDVRCTSQFQKMDNLIKTDSDLLPEIDQEFDDSCTSLDNYFRNVAIDDDSITEPNPIVNNLEVNEDMNAIDSLQIQFMGIFRVSDDVSGNTPSSYYKREKNTDKKNKSKSNQTTTENIATSGGLDINLIDMMRFDLISSRMYNQLYKTGAENNENNILSQNISYSTNQIKSNNIPLVQFGINKLNIDNSDYLDIPVDRDTTRTNTRCMGFQQNNTAVQSNPMHFIHNTKGVSIFSNLLSSNEDSGACQANTKSLCEIFVSN